MSSTEYNFFEGEMNMKIVGVMSSAHPEGNSATLVKAALKGAAAEGAKTTEIFLAQHRIDFCRGCLSCMRDGGCPLPDDFERLRGVLIEADGIVFGAPTFGYAPNARMKNFFDRFGLFEFFTASLGGKHLAAISTASRPAAARKTAAMMSQLFSGGVFKRAYVAGVMGAKAQSKGSPVDGRDLQKATALGRKLAQGIQRGRTYPWQQPLRHLTNALVVRPGFRASILKYKEDMMKGVFLNLRGRGLI
jgi:multimeric flavodoxin WrbA